MSPLLRTNAKLEKTVGEHMIAGLTLAPHSLSGHQVCDGRSTGCAASCNLWFAGQRVTPNARHRALTDTRDLFTDRPAFIERLNKDIAALVRRAEKYQVTPLIRLNVASDLEWFDVIKTWPDVQFYDYTKIRARFKRYLAGDLPDNYALTFSRHEKHHGATIKSFLRRGGNVAQVFDVDYYPAVGRVGDLPKSVRVHGQEFPVIDGDKHDVRLPSVDGRGVIVGLRLKGTNAAKSRHVTMVSPWGSINETPVEKNGRVSRARHQRAGKCAGNGRSGARSRERRG